MFQSKEIYPSYEKKKKEKKEEIGKSLQLQKLCFSCTTLELENNTEVPFGARGKGKGILIILVMRRS